jgi:glucan-binding YG repeat protein
MGHAAGLDDVYDLGANTSVVSGSLMYGCEVANPVATASRYDLNGLYITQHRRWFQSSPSVWKCWQSAGVFASNWQQLQETDNNWYWFWFSPSTQEMARNAWASDSTGMCYLGNDGRPYISRWLWYAPDNSWYYLDSNGYMAMNAWQQDSGGMCYLKANGRAAVNEYVYIDSIPYYFDSDGHLVL